MDRHVGPASIAAVGSRPRWPQAHAPHDQRTDAGAEDEQENDTGHALSVGRLGTQAPESVCQLTRAELDRRVRTRARPCASSRHPKVAAPMKT